MNMRLLIPVSLASWLVAGCVSSRVPSYQLSVRPNDVLPQDVKQAEVFRQTLPVHLWLDTNSVQIVPGPGVTEVLVYGVYDQALREKITSDVAGVNAQDAFNQLRVTFK